MFDEVKILETAKQYRDESLKWFEDYQNTRDEICYDMASHKMAYAEGLLEAFEIITGRRVITVNIEDELSNY